MLLAHPRHERTQGALPSHLCPHFAPETPIGEQASVARASIVSLSLLCSGSSADRILDLLLASSDIMCRGCPAWPCLAVLGVWITAVTSASASLHGALASSGGQQSHASSGGRQSHAPVSSGWVEDDALASMGGSTTQHEGGGTRSLLEGATAAGGPRPRIFVINVTERFRDEPEAWTWIHTSLYGLELVGRGRGGRGDEGAVHLPVWFASDHWVGAGEGGAEERATSSWFTLHHGHWRIPPHTPSSLTLPTSLNSPYVHPLYSH